MKIRHSEPFPLSELTSRFTNVMNRAGNSARLLFGSGKEHLVEEVVNDVLLLLWKRHLAGNLPDSPESWAATVAWNRAAKIARVEGRYVAGLVEEQDESTD